MTSQELDPIIPLERVHQFASDESRICLQTPPFPTIAQEWDAGGASDFWERFGALDQIEPDKSLIIGDFGIGSDSPIILEFGRNASNPPVLRLRWKDEQQTDWIQGARDFDEFAALLGLVDVSS